eukprot:TRINITY_DN27420_c0_g1_i1.p1 TRINITY_DN27420_c0_g1~~TRINITY_DN27420_c0_g1_i1.p1  ORF type:complete len:373 (-),score=62.89 TRINITY_DN27420_c0_g1_i1:115-1233(-)
MQNIPRDGIPWTIILGGAIVSTLSICVVRKLRQTFLFNSHKNAHASKDKEDACNNKDTLGACSLHSNYCTQERTACTHCILGASYGSVEMKLAPQGVVCQFENMRRNSPIVIPHQSKLSELQIHSEGREDSPLWSPEQLELHNGNLMLSNSSESICTSDSGSEHFSKRDVVLRLRDQLKKRDDMILEMQSQINDQLKIISNQISHITNLQSQLDSTNRDLFEAEREIQRVRKAIADHCVDHGLDISNNYALVEHSNKSIVNIEVPKIACTDTYGAHNDKNQEQRLQHGDAANSSDVNVLKLVEDLDCFPRGSVSQNYSSENMKNLQREIAELKESLEGKNYLLEMYEKQRLELCSQLRELQVKLAAQMSTIL